MSLDTRFNLWVEAALICQFGGELKVAFKEFKRHDTGHEGSYVEVAVFSVVEVIKAVNQGSS